MLACAAVARSSVLPPGERHRVLRKTPSSPATRDRLRFEARSSCCGVHARLDLLPAALAEPPMAAGTTNVDFNDAMRAAAGRRSDPRAAAAHVGLGELVVDVAEGR